MAGFTLLDLALAIPLVLWFIKGVRNGFVKEAVGMVGLMVAIALTFSLLIEAHALLVDWVGKDTAWMPIVAGLIIFLGVMLLTQILIFSLTKALEVAALSPFNRLLGGAFAAAKIGIVLSLILMMLAGFNKPDKLSRQNSVLYHYVLPFATNTYNVIVIAMPGAANFKETMESILEENNPLRRIMEEE